MNAPPAERASFRTDARLDPATRQKVDNLSQHFGRPRAAVLCHIMEWGLGREQTGPLDQGEAQGPVRHLYLYVASALYERVEKAAIATGMKIAPWLRRMVRQITITDFSRSWQEERLEKRSHDSHTYGRRFMLRLDEPSQTKLQQLVKQFGTSKAHIICQLMLQATPEDFPTSWHTRTAERRAPQAPRDHIGKEWKSKP